MIPSRATARGAPPAHLQAARRRTPRGPRRLRVAAVGVPAGNVGTGTGLASTPTRTTHTAGAAQPGDPDAVPGLEPRRLRTDRHHVTDDFVPRDPKRGPAEPGHRRRGGGRYGRCRTPRHARAPRRTWCGLASFDRDEPPESPGRSAHRPGQSESTFLPNHTAFGSVDPDLILESRHDCGPDQSVLDGVRQRGCRVPFSVGNEQRHGARVPRRGCPAGQV